ncbi:PIR Superfamily Protein [Plasmodium ovale wallikeri]|uniref:PIR Superfamily Protein n=1 Tax=Plasmodium ovale wallikeri TaxID=864142 RepID=A0A1A9AH58_PLAOA|nr:PIR Superfamily Protein [Plasmodium ovale wallikeri]
MATGERSLNKKTLPSVIFLKFLYENNNVVQKINNKIGNTSDSNYTEIISIIEGEFENIRKEIELTFNDDHEICCRNINYYFDILNATIKSANVFSGNILDNVIANVEQQWKRVLNVKNLDECKKEIDIDSIRKRCILKHLHDSVEDKKFILSFLEKYKEYLKEKWEKLIDYTNGYHDKLYIKIENDFMGIIDKYSNFLMSSDYICDAKLVELSTDDITISSDMNTLTNAISLEKFTNKDYDKGCYNKLYIDMLKYKTSKIQRINNFLSLGILLLGFSLILIFLYRFSPLRNLLHKCTKKRIEVDENVQVMSELHDNFENERHYISYDSLSH